MVLMVLLVGLIGIGFGVFNVADIYWLFFISLLFFSIVFIGGIFILVF